MLKRFFPLIIVAQLCFGTLSLSHAGNLSDRDLVSLYQSMQGQSEQTMPYAVTADEQAQYPLFGAFTRLRRSDDGRYNSYSNATLIAQSRCHLLASTAGHSLLDPIRGYPVSLSRLEVLLPSGDWVKPVEKHHPAQLQQDSKEYSDWALLVLPKPDCPAISSPRQSWYALPTVSVNLVDQDLFGQCRDNSEMICYHPAMDTSAETDATHNKAEARLLRESGCSLRTQTTETQSAVALTSCKQSLGVSGCAVLCSRANQVLSLGIFTQGLRPAGSQSERQSVGVFRLMNGELWQAVSAIMQRYNMRSGS